MAKTSKKWLSELIITFLESSVLTHYGGLVIAMTGKNCVAVAADRRLSARALTIATDFQKIFEIGPRIYIGLPGLPTDCSTIMQKLRFRKNIYEMREKRQIKPQVVAEVLSNLMYEQRFGPYFVEPVIAGLNSVTHEPYICSMDVLGSLTETDDFVVSGTSAAQAFGMCEAIWKPDLLPDDLFEKISQALVNAFDRDALSGWGGIVYIVEKDRVTIKSLKTRMD